MNADYPIMKLRKLSYVLLFCAIGAFFTFGCRGGGGLSGISSSKLQAGEEVSTVIRNGTYIFNTERVSRDYSGPVFYEEGRVRVVNEPDGLIRVTLLDQRGGDFAFVNNNGALQITDAHIGYGNVQYELTGSGLLLQGNQARGVCKAKLKNAGRRDFRQGTWTLRPR